VQKRKHSLLLLREKAAEEEEEEEEEKEAKDVRITALIFLSMPAVAMPVIPKTPLLHI
jgi:CO dehydrogenase/acetyl-CoA synthase beta subunit